MISLLTVPSVVVEIEDHVGLRYRVERDVDHLTFVQGQGDDLGDRTRAAGP